ncbi:MAG: FtsQ-type POTRA domain-containing protein [Anaerolineae bacterium]
MRIDLVENAKNQRQGRRDHRKKRRKARTFDSAVALPRVPERRAGKTTRRRDGMGESRPSERQAGTRRQRAPRSPEATAERQARRARVRAVARRLPALLLLAALVGTIVFASADARFFVYEATIRGAQHLPATTIYQAAGVHEQNIFWIDPGEVARRIVALEGIKAVEVTCELPARVVIEVEERQPVILWRAQSQERDWWVDAEGRVLPYHGDVDSPETVFVLDSSERHLDVGHTVEPQGLADSVLKLAEALPEVQVFYYQADRGLSFTQQGEAGSWPVYVGSSEDLARKIQVMLALTGYLQTNGVRPLYVDVRWADHPVYGRPAADATGGGE